MATIIVQQDAPGPQLGVENVYTGVTVGVATGDSIRSAAASAEDQSFARREAAMDLDMGRGCPAFSNPVGPAKKETVGFGGFQNFLANPDDDTYVSMVYHEWVVTQRCDGNFDPAAPGADEVHEIAHIEPLVCGATRTSGGVVVAKAYGTSATAALRSARDRARARALDVVVEQMNANCPDACNKETDLLDVQEGGKAVLLKRIPQARDANGRRVFVRYYAVWWTVTIRCDPAEENKEEKK